MEPNHEISTSPVAFAYFFNLATSLTSPAKEIALQHNNATWAFFGLWMFHYIHRSIIYPLNAPAMSPSSVLTAAMAVLFNICNGTFVTGVDSLSATILTTPVRLESRLHQRKVFCLLRQIRLIHIFQGQLLGRSCYFPRWHVHQHPLRLHRLCFAQEQGQESRTRDGPQGAILDPPWLLL